MIKASHLDDSLVVLRDITLGVRPHVLPRPTAKAAVSAVARAAVPAAATGSAPLPAPASAPASAPLSAAEETRLHERFKQGHAKGWLEGQMAERKAAETRDKSAAYQQGLEQGREAARQAARAEVEQRIAALDALLRTIPEQLAARVADAEDDMVALCFEAVCQMAGSAAATPDGLRQLLRQAAARLRTQRGLTVHLHADDLAMLAADPQGAGIDGVQLVADPQVKLGGAILRAQQGSLDARLEAQLALLKDLLMQQRRAHAQAADCQPEAQA